MKQTFKTIAVLALFAAIGVILAWRGVMLIATGIVAHADMPGNVVCVPTPPAISSRWTPRQVLRRDTAAGTFEHVNPSDYSNDALYLQQALLYHESAMPRRVSWFGLLLPLALLACGAFWYGVTP